MKAYFPLASLLLFLLCSTAHGQLMTFVLSSSTNSPYPVSTNIFVPADSVLEWNVVNCGVKLRFPSAPGATNYDGPVFFNGDTWLPSGSIRMVAGPALLAVSMVSNVQPPIFGLATVRITKQATTITPSTAVVIPSDAQGPVEILLESSTNLVHWEQALPGTYGTTSAIRYFRVRSVQK